MEMVWNLVEEGVKAGCITQNKWVASSGYFLGEELSLKSLAVCEAEAKVGLCGQ